MAEDQPKIYSGAHPELNPVDLYRCAVTEGLSEISGISPEVVYPALQWQNNLAHGDLVLAAPRLQVKGTPPNELVKKLAAQWAEKPPFPHLISPPEVDKIFLRFRFAPQHLAPTVISTIFRLGDKYGLNPLHGLRDPSDPSKGAKKALVEFSSPNIAKNFHAGHLRSTIIGAFISTLLEGCGWDVHRINYLGDWGRQYGLLAIGWSRFGSEEKFAADPIAHLHEIYVKISALFKPEEDAYKAASKAGQDTSELEKQGLLGEAKGYFKRMEEGDEEALALWRRFRSVSIEKYKQTYGRLNIVYQEYAGESQVSPQKMDEAEKILAEKDVSELSEQATVINFKKFGAKNLETAIMRNRNGTSTYLLRDIGEAMRRWETHHFDKSYYVVMSEQEPHVKRIIKTMDLMGWKEASKNMEYIPFGPVAGMSTRKGTVKFLSDILEECQTSMHEAMRKNEKKYAEVAHPEQTADTLGISACLIQDMSAKRINGYRFDISRMTSFEGDTGPYLQYAYARLCSIARKTGFSTEEIHAANLSLLQEPHAVDLIRLISQYPDMVIHTLSNLEPSTIITYMFRLTHKVSSSYDVLRVVDAPEGPEVSKARAALYEAAKQVVGNGMRLLGLSPVERM